ncbi:MAG TPA: hypothetical protein VIO64_02605 [Pseudobacteroides sp.]|uniref:hypothetical protein n=1 Tax=Pseudobacteroides sp. TaxID=1968840 RepID=UPI002F947817
MLRGSSSNGVGHVHDIGSEPPRPAALVKARLCKDRGFNLCSDKRNMVLIR